MGLPKDFHHFLQGQSQVRACPCCTTTLQLSWHPPASGMGFRNPAESWRWLGKGGANTHTFTHRKHKVKKKGFCPKELPLDLQFCKQEHTQQLNSKENITLLLFSKLLVWMLLSGLLLQHHNSVSLTGSQVSWCINTVICPAAWRTTGILNQAQESFKDKADAQIQDWVNLTVRG